MQALTLTPRHFAALLGLAPYLVEEFQVHAHYLREMASDEKVDDLMKWRWAWLGVGLGLGFTNPNPIPTPTPTPNPNPNLT